MVAQASGVPGQGNVQQGRHTRSQVLPQRRSGKDHSGVPAGAHLLRHARGGISRLDPVRDLLVIDPQSLPATDEFLDLPGVGIAGTGGLALPQFTGGTPQQLSQLQQALYDKAYREAHAIVAGTSKTLLAYSQEFEQSLPKRFKGVLRTYQKAGYDWLLFLKEYGFGGDVTARLAIISGSGLDVNQNEWILAIEKYISEAYPWIKVNADEVGYLGPDIDEIEPGSSFPFGIWLRCWGTQLNQDHVDPLIRAGFMPFEQGEGWMLVNTRDTIWIRMNSESAHKNNWRRMGQCLLGMAKINFPLVEKVEAQIIIGAPEVVMFEVAAVTGITVGR